MTNGNDTINVCHPQTDLGRGLTKREYFAAMALQGILAKGYNSEYEQTDAAKISVGWADALINALNENSNA